MDPWNFNEIHAYQKVKSAIEQAERMGFGFDIYSDHLFLKRNDRRSPEHPFFTATELHCYLNGLNDSRAVLDIKGKVRTK